MSRKEFNAIAAILSRLHTVYGNNIPHEIIVRVFAEYLETTNERFEPKRFVAACKGEWK